MNLTQIISQPFRWGARQVLSGEMAALDDLRGRVMAFESTYAQLEDELRRQGFERTGLEGDRLSRGVIRQSIESNRVMLLENPLVIRGSSLYWLYTFGQGWTLELPEDAGDPAEEALKAITEDEGNHDALFSPAAMMAVDRELLATGMLFVSAQTENAEGKALETPAVRIVSYEQIDDIAVDSQDGSRPKLYKRKLKDAGNGLVSTTGATGSDKYEWIPDGRWASTDEGKAELDELVAADGGKYDGHPIAKGRVIFSRAVMTFPGWVWGYPPIRAAKYWSQRHSEFLTDAYAFANATMRVAEMYAYKSGASKDRLDAAQSALKANFVGSLENQNKPNVAGSTIIGGPDLKYDKMSGGTGIDMNDNRAAVLQVARIFGLPEIFFGDQSASNLATAKAMERPVEMLFTSRRRWYGGLLSGVAHYALRAGIQRNGSSLSQDQRSDLAVTVSWPDLLEHDLAAEVARTISMLTLDGKSLSNVWGKLPRAAYAELLKSAKINDVDGKLDMLEKAGAFTPQPDATGTSRNQADARAALQRARRDAA